MFSKVLAIAGLIASLAINTVNAIPTIEAVGAKFFYSNGTQYYIKGMAILLLCAIIADSSKGIAYQLTEADPLIDTTQCQLDAVSMEALGANAIRVYHVDPSADHTGCMKAFADAGIYLFVDLETFNTAIDPVSGSHQASVHH
jgi:1,3-beta-glucanosyltransferase GAS1